MKRLTLFMTSFAIGVLTITLLTATAHADGFNQNKIIDDAIFDKSSSMTAAQIDAFLNSFPNSCISPNSGFKAIDPTGYTPTTGYTYGGFVSAGQVIYDAAQAYRINPQVLLSTLQKEQSLVIGGTNFCENGDLNKYTAAVGYGCPDSGTTYSYTNANLYQRNGVAITSSGITCVNSMSKAGFSQQIIHGTWLLKFGEQRSEGNINWAVIKPGWDNSDDPQSCYGGPMTQGSWQRCPSGITTYFDGYTTIDNTAVHMDNGATATLYWYTPHFHGNQSFYTIFTGWFGNTLLPTAFKTPTSDAVYMQTNGYKFTVPSMALLQDLGISPGSIQTISQSTADAIPTPDTSTTNLSTSIGYVVKSTSDTDSDGGSVYLISLGRRYGVVSMAQFADFGFDVSKISYLPLSYLYSLPYGGALSNYISTPTSNVFKVTSGTKRIILDSAKYTSLNPTGNSSYVSTGTAVLVPSGLPISDKAILVGTTNSAIYLFVNGIYYTVPSMDTYDCWGFPSGNVPTYLLAYDNYISAIGSPPSISCAVNTNSSTTYLLNGSTKINVPASFGLTSPIINSDLAAVTTTLPTRVTALSPVLKTSNTATIWYLESGVKKFIPTMTDFNLLGLSISQIDVLLPGALNSIPSSGFKLGVGQIVKATGGAAVYVITSPSSRTAFVSSDDFSAYGYLWTNLLTLPDASLDLAYPLSTPSTLSKYLYDQASGKVYLMDVYGCFSLSSSQITSFGQTQSSIQAAQLYSATVFPAINFNACGTTSLYVKNSNQATVYWVDAGKKNPIATWSKLVSFSGQANPYILTLSDSTLATLPTGPLVP